MKRRVCTATAAVDSDLLFMSKLALDEVHRMCDRSAQWLASARCSSAHDQPWLPRVPEFTRGLPGTRRWRITSSR